MKNNGVIADVLTNEMVINFNVLSALMENIISRDLKSIETITIERCTYPQLTNEARQC